jgi:SAM-dependent methyltransferase
MDRQAVFRRLLETRLFSGFYGRVIGPASVQLFGELLAEELLPRLPQRAKVLEVGCGPGLQAIDLLRRRPDLELTASDFSAAFVELARRNAAAAGISRLDFAVANAMDLSCFPAATFDAVYSITAIKHFPDPVHGLRECLRVVKPGGLVVVAEIRRESSLDDVQRLVALFHLPAGLKAAAARFVHGTLCEECPPLEAVAAWLGQLGVRGDAAPRALPGQPAWVAKLEQPLPREAVRPYP